MTTSVGNWSVIGFSGDPVQGEPTNVQALATFHQREVSIWQEHANEVNNAAQQGNAMLMKGSFVRPFRARLDDHPPRTRAILEGHRGAGSALQKYLQQLEQAKTESRAALQRGTQAKQQLDQAIRAEQQINAEINALPKVVPYPQLPAVQAQYQQLVAQFNRAKSFELQADQELRLAQQQAQQAGQQARQAETACAQAIMAGIPQGTQPFAAAKPVDVPISGLGTSAPLSDVLAKVNPKFSDANPDYSENCTHCVQGFELRRRGYDVTAKSLPTEYHGDGRGLDVISKPWGRNFTSGDREAIEKAFADPGSRGVVALKWANGRGGHVFNVENVDGKVRFVDGQNATPDASKYFTVADPKSLKYVRLDDLPTPPTSPVVGPSDY